MIRAVLDTNLLVSYLLTYRPPIATLLDDFGAGDEVILVTSPELLAELDRVLTYPKLQRYYTNEERTRFVALIMALSEVVDLPDTLPRICRGWQGRCHRQWGRWCAGPKASRRHSHPQGSLAKTETAGRI